MPELSPRQSQVLGLIERYWNQHGVSPSTGEMAVAIGLSRQTVYEHMLALERKGLITHIEGQSRSWRLLRRQPSEEPNPRLIPLVGRVAAGAPVLAQENIESWIASTRHREGETLFALRVQGESMVETGILDGDLVVVRQQEIAENGDIVLALVDGDSATIKRFFTQGQEVLLVPANADMEVGRYHASRVAIQGKVVESRRTYES